MSDPIRLSIRDTLRAVRAAFEKDLGPILRVTLIYAALYAASTLLDLTGALGLALSVGIFVLLNAAYGGVITAMICLPGQADGIRELWDVVKPVLARLIWVTLVVTVATFAGLVMLIVPGLIVFTLLSVATQTVVVERPGVFESLGRSFELVKDNAWQTFGFLMVIGIVSLALLVLAMLITLPFGSGVAVKLAAAFIGDMVSGPPLAVGSAVLYNELTRLGRETELPEEPDPFAPH